MSPSCCLVANRQSSPRSFRRQGTRPSICRNRAVALLCTSRISPRHSIGRSGRSLGSFHSRTTKDLRCACVGGTGESSSPSFRPTWRDPGNLGLRRERAAVLTQNRRRNVSERSAVRGPNNDNDGGEHCARTLSKQWDCNRQLQSGSGKERSPRMLWIRLRARAMRCSARATSSRAASRTCSELRPA